MTTKYIRTLTPLFAFAFAAGACTTRDRANDSLAADTALNRDLQLANRDTAAQPQLQDVPAGTSTQRSGTTGSGTASRSTATRSGGTGTTRSTTSTGSTSNTSRTASGNTVTTGSTGGGGAVSTLPSGTSLTATSNARICTNTNKVGDSFTATVSNAVSGGGVTIPAGSQIRLTITELKRSENANDPIQIGFRVEQVTVAGRAYPMSATVATSAITRERNTPRSKDAQKVAIGAAVGAAAGQILGKSTKSTVIGAAAGAAAGAGAAAATANYEGCLPNGGALTITTTAPTTIRL